MFCRNQQGILLLSLCIANFILGIEALFAFISTLSNNILGTVCSFHIHCNALKIHQPSTSSPNSCTRNNKEIVSPFNYLEPYLLLIAPIYNSKLIADWMRYLRLCIASGSNGDYPHFGCYECGSVAFGSSFSYLPYLRYQNQNDMFKYRRVDNKFCGIQPVLLRLF